MPGESNSRIQDGISAENEDQSYLTASVYGDSIYPLRVQLDCDAQTGRDSSSNPCSSSLSIVAWIDYNDNEFDDTESALLGRSWSDNAAPTGAYELNIRIPSIDGRIIKPGLHRLRLTVMPSAEYQRDCGSFNYQEIKDYSVNVLRKARVRGKFFSACS